jgi:GntR family transcriptional regulator
MLRFHVNPHSGVPAYRQLMEQVKYSVASGLLREGDRLPSIRELAHTLSVNPATIVKAYGELQHEGIIELQQGRGVFVSASAGRMTDRQRRETLRPVARQLAVEAVQLGASDELVTRLLQEEREKLEKRRKTR